VHKKAGPCHAVTITKVIHEDGGIPIQFPENDVSMFATAWAAGP